MAMRAATNECPTPDHGDCVAQSNSASIRRCLQGTLPPNEGTLLEATYIQDSMTHLACIWSRQTPIESIVESPDAISGPVKQSAFLLTRFPQKKQVLQRTCKTNHAVQTVCLQASTKCSFALSTATSARTCKTASESLSSTRENQFSIL